jgi:small subunit ribosomal protein S20
MAHTKSAKKRLRQSKKRRLRNRAVKSNVKTQVKTLLASVQEGSAEETRDAYRTTAKKLDQAAAKGIIHPNTAARKKSRLAKALNAKK